MSSVSDLLQRLDTFLLALTYQDTFNSIRSKCDALIAAMHQVKGSMRFKCVLHVCLVGGNILNNDSKQAGVTQGFKISTFSKLLQTKTKTGTSFLDYIVEKLLDTSPDMLEMKDEFDTLGNRVNTKPLTYSTNELHVDIDGSKQISLKVMGQDIRNLELGLLTVKKLKEGTV